MFWFKKKKPEEEQQKDSGSDEGGDESESENKPAVSANVEIELTKIKSQLEALNEVRKANSEQFTRLSEQIGELRGTLMDSNKAISVIEVESTRAIDLVNSVQPDKLMIEVRKTDSKTEALRANIEANETIMRDLLRELKEMRGQMNFYKGVDQVVKMNNEIKQELIDIKKSEGTIGKHADRVETIFVEVEKKFYDFEKFNEAVKELDRSFKKISSDFDKMRVSLEEKADKKEFVKLVDKFSDFEKHTSSILKLLDQRSKNTLESLNLSFSKLKEQLEDRYKTKLKVDSVVDEKKSATEEKQNNGVDKKMLASGSEKTSSSPDNLDSSSTDAVSSLKNSELKSDPDASKKPASEAKRGILGLFRRKAE